MIKRKRSELATQHPMSEMKQSKRMEHSSIRQ